MSKLNSLKKSVNKASNMMNSPCTITEAVQIARGVAEDTVSDYHRNQANVQLAMSFQIEIMKEVIFSSGLISEEDFRQKYMEKAQEFQKMQAERVESEMEENPATTASMKVDVGDIEIKTEE